MTYQDALKDYIEVKDRIQEFKKLFPEGSLQFEFGGQMEINGATVIYGRTYAYRDREDIRPGIGTRQIKFFPWVRDDGVGDFMLGARHRRIGYCNIQECGQS